MNWRFAHQEWRGLVPYAGINHPAPFLMGQTVATNFVKNFEIRYIVCYNVHRADFSEEMNGDS